jgi:hypothetical protein
VAGRLRRSQRQRHLAPLAPRPPGEARPRTCPGISACGDSICLATGAGRAWRSRAGTTPCTRRLPLALALMTHHRRSRSGTAPGCEHGRPFSRAWCSSPRPRSSRTSASRTSPGVRVRASPHRISKGELETKQDRRARRKTRKKMRHLAAALAEPNTPEFEGFPCSGSGKLPPQPTFRASPSGYNGIPSPFM